MDNNLNQSPHLNDEMDLREIIKLIIESKKLIVSSILIFTIASIIFSFSLKPLFETSAKLEIGYIEMFNGDRELIESASNLVSNLKIREMKNSDDKVNRDLSITSIEDKIIDLKIKSNSREQNEISLNEIIGYIDNRHSNLEKLFNDKKKSLITNEIESIKAEINHYKSKLSDEYQSQYLSIISNLDKEDRAIESLKLLAQQSQYNDKVFSLNQKLDILIKDSETNDSKFQSKTQIINNVKTKNIKPKILLILPISIIIGSIFGVFLALTINFFKSYNNKQA